MKIWSLGILALVLSNLAWSVGASPAPAAAEALDAGIDYQVIDPPVPTESGAQVEVVELFWYGCPHCFSFEPKINQWRATLPSDVVFRRLPAVIGPSWALHAKAFFAAEVLGVGEKIHQPLFEAIHKLDRKLNTEESLATFFAENGVDKNQFITTLRSFSVDAKTRAMQALTQRYGIDGVPTLVIDGRYRTGPGLVGTYDRAIQVADRLVTEARAARAAKP